MSHISDFYYWLTHLVTQFQENGADAIGQLDRHQWAILAVVTVTFGILCMRGYQTK